MVRDPSLRLFCNQDKSNCARRNDRDRGYMSAFSQLVSNSSSLLVDATPHAMASVRMLGTCLLELK